MSYKSTEQLIEMSAINGFKYRKMLDLDDEDIDVFNVDNQTNSDSNVKKSKRLKNILILSLSTFVSLLLFITIIVVFLMSECSVDYKGHKVYKLLPVSVEDLNAILKIEKNFKIDFWNEPHLKYPFEPILIQISSPEEEWFVKKELINSKINFTVAIEDLQTAIEEERVEHRMKHNENGFDFSRYHTYEEILDFLKQIVIENNFIEVHSMERSFEGRKIPVLRISSDMKDESKPIILMDSLIHSQEWVSGSTLLYIMNELIANNSLKYLIEKFDFYLIPVFNPDGYAYSWRTDRLWSKSRSFSLMSIYCRGVDLNSNFDLNFGNDYDNDNRSPCSDHYSGDYPFSEPEVQAFKDLVLKLNQTNRLKAYFSLHSFKQRILFPFEYKTDLIENIKQMQNLSQLASNAIKDYSGSTYTYGSASELTSLNSGASIDWIYDKIKVNLSFSLDLRDSGHYGYLLPRDMITPTAQEVFEGIKAIITSEMF